MKSRIYKLLHQKRMLQAPFHLDEIGWMFHHASNYSKCLDRPFICISFNHDKYDSNSKQIPRISFLPPGFFTQGSAVLKDEIFFSFPASATPRIWEFFRIEKSVMNFLFTPELVQLKNLIQERLGRISAPGVCDELDMLANLLITACMRQARKNEMGNAPIDNKVFEIADGLKRGERLNALLRKHSMGRRTFYMYWNRHFKVSPLKYKSEEQFQEARLLLEQSSIPIQEIAESCGFSSPIYFSLSFRKHTGMSPREYRNRFHEHLSAEQPDSQIQEQFSE